MNRTIYALGFFDGVHTGHAQLLLRCRELSAEYRCRSGAVTFASHPEARVLGKPPALINSLRDRERLMKDRFHMDDVVILPFDADMQTMHWQDFLKMLERDFGAAGFVCGEDFRFGSRGQGTAALLTGYCRERQLPCAVVPDQTIDGIRVSSTHIRRLIEAGDMEGAVRFLGHPHILSGTVVHGKALGRKLGFPTANLMLPRELAVPKFGAYATRAAVDGKIYAAVTNVGTRPTVEGSGITVETWLLDFSGDLYGRELVLEFYRFLRPEQKFPDLAALQQMTRLDAEQTRQFLKTTFTQ